MAGTNGARPRPDLTRQTVLGLAADHAQIEAVLSYVDTDEYHRIASLPAFKAIEELVQAVGSVNISLTAGRDLPHALKDAQFECLTATPPTSAAEARDDAALEERITFGTSVAKAVRDQLMILRLLRECVA